MRAERNQLYPPLLPLHSLTNSWHLRSTFEDATPHHLADMSTRYWRVRRVLTLVAPATAPLVGGALIADLSWRGIFLVTIPIGVASLALLRPALKRPPLPSLFSYTISRVIPQQHGRLNTAINDRTRIRTRDVVERRPQR
jgi:MFS family permease